MPSIAQSAVLLFAIFRCTTGDDNLKPSPLIIGGNEAPIGQYPYMASLRVNGVHICGGSIINEQWILTAAHCLTILKQYIEQADIVLGTNSLSNGGVTLKIDKIVVHNFYFYLWFTMMNDIGLIKLKTSITFDDKIKKIDLCTTQPSSNTLAIVSGWGLVGRNDANKPIIPDMMHFLEYRTVSWFVCFLRNFPNIVWFKFICAQATKSYGVCSGDSGSPLVVDNKQIGIVSWGKGCAIGTPDAYVNVCKYKGWIADNIKK